MLLLQPFLNSFLHNEPPNVVTAVFFMPKIEFKEQPSKKSFTLNKHQLSNHYNNDTHFYVLILFDNLLKK